MIDAEKSIDSFDPPDTNRLYPELFSIHRKIHDFSGNLDNLQCLLDIQKRLISAISAAEIEIKSAKSCGNDPREWQYVRYNFLCLGDSLAFLYMDRFSLKQTFFNVDNDKPKQDSGFLSGQAGLLHEVALLNDAIENGVPAVLCDLTNVIRYGDVCLLGGSDPFPIEVKSSNTRDSRGKRQKMKLKTLQDFLQLDQATDFRGIAGTTIRTAFTSPPRSFDAVLKAAISEAASHGTSIFEVDECLKVAVISGGSLDYDRFFSGVNPSRALVSFVNQIKTNMIWGCYFPYALTLSNPEHYEKFVRGDITIVSLLNMSAFEEKLAYDGVTLEGV